MSNYSINVGEVGVITDQFGGVLRVEVGPKGYATKGLFESVKYYYVSVQTEEMISPVTSTTTSEGIKVDTVDPAPLGDLNYGALYCETTDGNVYQDLAIQWHLNAQTTGWEDGLKTLYTNYPDESYAKQTIFNAVRDYTRNYIRQFSTGDFTYGNATRAKASNEITPYVQSGLNNLTSLGNSVVIDKIFLRRTTPSEQVQVAYNNLLVKTKEGEALLSYANLERQANIAKAEGQSIALSLVVNATTSAMNQLLSSNMSASEAVQYLQLQYQYDSLKSIAQSNPTWDMTLFINSPEATYTIPIKP